MKKSDKIYLFYKSKIENGDYETDKIVPNRKDIAEKFGTNKEEALLGIKKLEEIGYVKKENDQYEVVFKRVFRKVDRIVSFTNDVLSTGQVPGSIMLEYHLFRAKTIPVLKEKMNLNDDDLIHYIVRVRTINNLPVAMAYSYISSKYIKQVNIQMMIKSIYEMLISQGAKLRKVQGQMTAHMPTEDQEEHLKIENEALLKDVTYLFDQDQEVIAYDEIFYVSSRYGYFYTTE